MKLLDGIIINQITTLMIIFSYTIVVLIYHYLARTAPSEKAKASYKNLVYAWLLFTLTYVLLFIRNMSTSADFNIFINKINTASTAFGAIFLFFFLGNLYESKRSKKIMGSLGLAVGILTSIVYIAFGDFRAEETPYGIEVIPPPIVKLVVLLGIIVIIGSFLFTSFYLGIKTINPVLKRKIALVSMFYSAWWVFQLFEAGGILLDIMGPGGMLLNRIVLAIFAFIIILVWAGKLRFIEALRALVIKGSGVG